MRSSLHFNALRLNGIQTVCVARGFGESNGKKCIGLLGSHLRSGRLLFRLVALGLMGAGAFALLQSGTGHFLAHDLRYVGMETFELCGLGGGRVARFMIHDRVSFGGALIAIGLLYLWLELPDYWPARARCRHHPRGDPGLDGRSAICGCSSLGHHKAHCLDRSAPGHAGPSLHERNRPSCRPGFGVSIQLNAERAPRQKSQAQMRTSRSRSFFSRSLIRKASE